MKGAFRCLCVCAECGRQADRIVEIGSDRWATELEQVPEAIRECVRQYLVGMHKRKKEAATAKEAIDAEKRRKEAIERARYSQSSRSR